MEWKACLDCPQVRQTHCTKAMLCCQIKAEAEARIKKLIEHHRLVCNEICGNCDDFECPARGRS